MNQHQGRVPSPPLVRLVESGAGATGVAAGGLLGFLAGGPAGAAVGGATGAALQDGLKATASEIAERLTTDTERARVGSCLVLAHEHIARRLNGGDALREARFFERRTRRDHRRLRSEAEELLEGTFLAARDAYEERKVDLLARFYANAAFEQTLDTSSLIHVLSLAKLLTYRQLVILGVVGLHQMTDATPNVRASNFRSGGALPLPTVGALYEIYQLIGLQLIVSRDNNYLLGIADVNPAELKLQGTGAQLCNLLELHLRVPNEDREFFFEVFPR